MRISKEISNDATMAHDKLKAFEKRWSKLSEIGRVRMGKQQAVYMLSFKGKDSPAETKEKEKKGSVSKLDYWQKVTIQKCNAKRLKGRINVKIKKPPDEYEAQIDDWKWFFGKENKYDLVLENDVQYKGVNSKKFELFVVCNSGGLWTENCWSCCSRVFQRRLPIGCSAMKLAERLSTSYGKIVL
jgi:hypothetical protein